MLFAYFIFLFVIGGAFLYGLAEILHIQARNRGRSSAAWITFGCGFTIVAGVLGFLAFPYIEENLDLPADKKERLVFLSIWVPAVAAAAGVGGLLKLLGPVAAGGAGMLRVRTKTLKAEEWHTKELCKACGFLIEPGDKICQCPTCGNYQHVRCWNDARGCPVCITEQHETEQA
jgi:hypothetical protein